jgi:molecular chaperone DnaK
MSKKVIGIDLGTGNSCLSTIEAGKPVVINNSEGGRTTPSVVNLKNGERIVGPAANRKRVIEPKETVYNIKRFMGSDYNKCLDVIDKMAYDVVNENGNPRVKIGDKKYSPEEISSFILGKLKKDAEAYLGEEVTDAVITCPAWFDGAAREATKIAGEMCGLNVLRIINEPTAALLSSDIDTSKGEKTILVADIGQGTTDFSVCEVSDGLIEVKASYGSKFLGGADFDQVIVDMIAKDIEEQYSIDITKDPMAMQRVMEAAEKAKIELSNTVTTDISLPYISMTQNGPVNYSSELTRAKFDQLSNALITKIIDCGKKAVNDSGKKYSEIDCILLVGGQSRSIAIQDALTKEFGIPLNKSVNPDEAVSLGAAIQANIIVGGEGSEDILLLDCTAVGVGILTEGNIMTTMIPANTTIPTQKSQIFSTAVDNQPGIEVVVLQGERPRGTDNKVIGRFSMDVLPARRGVPQIEITYSIDASGIISVTAIDKGTNKEQHITIENASKLSDEEVERIKREAKEHEEEDKKFKENAEKANRCESLIYQTEQQIENFKDNEKFTEDDKTYFTGKIDELKKIKDANDYSKFEELEKEIQSKWFEISAKMYAAPNGDNTNPMEDVMKNAGFNAQAEQQPTEEDLNQQEVG